MTPRVTSRLLEVCGKPIGFSGPDYRRVEVLGLEVGKGGGQPTLLAAEPS